MPYHPPCTISPVIERLLGEIREIVGPLYESADREGDLKLRRVNRLRTICGVHARHDQRSPWKWQQRPSKMVAAVPG